jgi:hypothetical protein
MRHLHAAGVAHLHPAGATGLDPPRTTCLHPPGAGYLQVRVDFGVEKNILEGPGGDIDAQGKVALVILPISHRSPGSQGHGSTTTRRIEGTPAPFEIETGRYQSRIVRQAAGIAPATRQAGVRDDRAFAMHKKYRRSRQMMKRALVGNCVYAGKSGVRHFFSVLALPDCNCMSQLLPQKSIGPQSIGYRRRVDRKGKNPTEERDVCRSQ